jgi:5-(carboxyamino)imidazole ribonucleotide mutase
MLDPRLGPLVSIVMGSASDLRVMQAASERLAALGIAHELDIVSAHRTPDKLYAHAAGLAERGIVAAIAGAGGAAHLPGMLAALTLVPVIGVPIAATSLSGMDALLSVVQMPAGIPVATVAIDNAENAALLAAQIVQLVDPEVRKRLAADRAASRDKRADPWPRPRSGGTPGFR